METETADKRAIEAAWREAFADEYIHRMVGMEEEELFNTVRDLTGRLHRCIDKMGGPNNPQVVAMVEDMARRLGEVVIFRCGLRFQVNDGVRSIHT